MQYDLSAAMNEDGVGYKIFRMNEVVDGRMVDDGSMKHIDIDAEEFKTYKLAPGDLLFKRTNGSFDQVGKTGLFDLDGDYCFASYLVRVVPGTDIDPKYLNTVMNSSQFLGEIRQQAVRSAGQHNINASKLKRMTVPVPPPKRQVALVQQLAGHRQAQQDAAAVLAAGRTRKTQALRDGLR